MKEWNTHFLIFLLAEAKPYITPEIIGLHPETWIGILHSVKMETLESGPLILQYVKQGSHCVCNIEMLSRKVNKIFMATYPIYIH